MNINHQVTEGETGIRDLHLLESAVQRPALVVFGEAQFPSVASKAAALMHSLAYHHLFFDGNKRTAIAAVRLFLARNGFGFAYQAPQDDAFVLEIAQGQHEIATIEGWLRERIAP